MTLGGVYKFKVNCCILTKGIYGPLSAPTYNRFKNLNCQVIDIFREQVRQLHHSINLKMSLSEKTNESPVELSGRAILFELHTIPILASPGICLWQCVGIFQTKFDYYSL